MKPLKYRSLCPMSRVLDLLGDKWSLLIVRDILLRGHRTHSAFRGADEGIATNILADRLTRLETDGIITKVKDENDGRSEIFSLTEKGIDLLPMLLAMTKWSAKHDEAFQNPPEMQESVSKLMSAIKEMQIDHDAGADLSAGRMLWRDERH